MMKGARIYKDNFRENPLFSLFLADTSPIILIGIAVGVIELVLYLLVFHITNFPLIFLTVGISEMGFFVLTTGKRDNEMKYKAVPRQVGFALTSKHYATKELDKSISDFKIIGNYMQRRKNLIAVYEIYPSDITFLNNEALEQFYQNIKMSYHNLSTKVMLISKKQTVTAKDYNSHFYSLYTTADAKRESLVKQYQEELSEFIEDNNFKKIKHYAVFSTPLLSQSDKHFALATKQLFDFGTRFTSALLPVNITTKQLTHEELKEYCKSQLQKI